MLLAEEQTSQHNQIVSRFADAPEGPWSDDIVVYDVADPAFRNLYYAHDVDLGCLRRGPHAGDIRLLTYFRRESSGQPARANGRNGDGPTSFSIRAARVSCPHGLGRNASTSMPRSCSSVLAEASPLTTTMGM